MIGKNKQDIDELLNSFLDDELTSDQRLDVRQLITSDAQVARRLVELKKCKALLQGLPPAEAPGEMLERIRASVDGRASLRTDSLEDPVLRAVGTRHLMMRKLMSAAAMLLLVAVLVAVIYTIVAPERVPDRSSAVKDLERPLRIAKMEETPKAAAPAVPVNPAELFSGRLELAAAGFAAADAFVNKTIENSSLEYLRLQTSPGRSVYNIRCGRKGLNALAAGLEGAWNRFGSASLFVAAADNAEIEVAEIDTKQLIGIAGQDTPAAVVKVAKDVAVLNRARGLMSDSQVLAFMGGEKADFAAVPMPVLTTGEKKAAGITAGTEEKKDIYLTIVITAAK